MIQHISHLCQQDDHNDLHDRIIKVTIFLFWVRIWINEISYIVPEYCEIAGLAVCVL